LNIYIVLIFTYYVLCGNYLATSLGFSWGHRCVAILSSAYHWGAFQPRIDKLLSENDLNLKEAEMPEAENKP